MLESTKRDTAFGEKARLANSVYRAVQIAEFPCYLPVGNAGRRTDSIRRTRGQAVSSEGLIQIHTHAAHHCRVSRVARTERPVGVAPHACESRAPPVCVIRAKTQRVLIRVLWKSRNALTARHAIRVRVRRN